MCKANYQHVHLQVSKINSIVTWMAQWHYQAINSIVIEIAKLHQLMLTKIKKLSGVHHLFINYKDNWY